MSQTKILLIDDDQQILHMLKMTLELDGFQVLTAESGFQGLTLLKENPDIIFLDVLMPNMNGWETCQRLRDLTNAPIIILTALGTSSSKTNHIKAYKSGADYYLTKPFNREEIILCINVLLRRMGSGESNMKVDAIYDDGFLSIDLIKRQVFRLGKPINLTRKEFRLLSELMYASPGVASNLTILNKVWENDLGANYDMNPKETEPIRGLVSRLRKKLEPDTSTITYIQTVRGEGFRFSKQTNSINSNSL